MSAQLTLDDLDRAVRGGVAAARSRSRLQPAGGPGDKVFPPTYATGDRELKYAREKRRIDGCDVDCVLLDSVASQANRMEEALFQAWEEDQLPFPVIAVDFTADPDDADLADLDRISTLHAPHRVYDALLRDSVCDDGTLFRDTELGRAITDATCANATALYRACPTGLLFGAWDSTGPKGGLGTKFQRVVASEIVAINAVPGVKVSSRIDPAGIQANVPVYHHKANHDDYTIDPDEAKRDKKGNPVPFSRKGAEGKGKPSAINHSNVTPSIDAFAGGITFDYAIHTAVLSFSALRRLRFPQTVEGKRLEGNRRMDAERAARTALAALGITAIALLWEVGFDLRSRCALVPEHPFALEFVPSGGGAPESFAVDAAAAKKLLKEAHERARELGFGWEREPMRLAPAPKLAALIKKSRTVAAAAGSEQEDA